MKTSLRHIDDHGVRYDALAFWCPGCESIDDDGDRQGGLHMIAVNSPHHPPSWEWDGNLDAPTLSPSILTKRGEAEQDARPLFVCHSFLRAGVFEFLGDCTHNYAGQNVPLPDLPDGWFDE